MFKTITNEIRLIVERVKAGNAYRAELYKEYVEPEYVRPAQPKCLPMWPSDAQCREIESQKMKYQYWDEWTGGRYDRVENPYMNRSYFEEHHRMNDVVANVAYREFMDNIKYDEVIRSNAVTGYWEPVNEIHGDEV